MRSRKLMAIAALMVGIVALIIATYQHSREPFEPKVVSTELSGILDDAGKEFLLVELQIANRGVGALLCTMEHKRVEARIGGRWVEAENLWNIGNLWAHDKRAVTLLLPAGTDTCRISFEYQSEPMQISVFRQLGFSFQKTTARIIPKRLYSWLWPNVVPMNPSGWRTINLEVPMPRIYAQHAAICGRQCTTAHAAKL